MLGKIGARWKLRRLRRELEELLYRDREMRSEPGETSMHLASQMVAIGQQIAVLRFEIVDLEEDLLCDT